MADSVNVIGNRIPSTRRGKYGMQHQVLPTLSRELGLFDIYNNIIPALTNDPYWWIVVLEKKPGNHGRLVRERVTLDAGFMMDSKRLSGVW